MSPPGAGARRRGFPTFRPTDLEARPEPEKWLVEQLWGDQAVGIIGGEPKCCKSFLALDIAVAVATGARCLRRFAVAAPGTALLFAAEDVRHILRERLAGIARGRRPRPRQPRHRDHRHPPAAPRCRRRPMALTFERQFLDLPVIPIRL